MSFSNIALTLERLFKLNSIRTHSVKGSVLWRTFQRGVMPHSSEFNYSRVNYFCRAVIELQANENFEEPTFRRRQAD